MSDVQALLIERDGYVQRGLKDRAAQVDAVLARMGFGGKPALESTPVVEAAVVAAVETAVAPKPATRQRAK